MRFLYIILSMALTMSPTIRAFDVVGEVEGRAVVVPVDKSALESLLRADYQLERVPEYPAGKHPLLLLFMKFKNVRPQARNFPFPPIGLVYHSLYVLVPFAHLHGHPLPASMTVMPKGLMNNRFMVMSSRNFNGLPKELAQIDWSDSTFTARQGQQVLVQALFKQHPGSSTLYTHLVRQLIDMPTLSDKPLGSANFGTSHATIDWANAHIIPIDAHITIDDSFLPGLNVKNLLIQSANDKATWGAFGFTSPFKIGKFIPLN